MDTIRGRRKNDRRHPGIKGKRPDKKEYRQAEAIERQATYDALSIEQKLAQLAPEPHAAKQRAKLNKQLAQRNKGSV